MHYGHAKKIGIARVQREQAGKMVACISLVNSIAGKGARLECVRSSGTVAALLRKA